MVPLGLTAATSLADAGTHKKKFSSRMKTLIILNKRIEGIMKIVKSLKNSSLLTKDDAKTIENEAKEQY